VQQLEIVYPTRLHLTFPDSTFDILRSVDLPLWGPVYGMYLLATGDSSVFKTTEDPSVFRAT